MRPSEVAASGLGRGPAQCLCHNKDEGRWCGAGLRLAVKGPEGLIAFKRRVPATTTHERQF